MLERLRRAAPRVLGRRRLRALTRRDANQRAKRNPPRSAPSPWRNFAEELRADVHGDQSRVRRCLVGPLPQPANPSRRWSRPKSPDCFPEDVSGCLDDADRADIPRPACIPGRSRLRSRDSSGPCRCSAPTGRRIRLGCSTRCHATRPRPGPAPCVRRSTAGAAGRNRRQAGRGLPGTITGVAAETCRSSARDGRGRSGPVARPVSATRSACPTSAPSGRGSAGAGDRDAVVPDAVALLPLVGVAGRAVGPGTVALGQRLALPSGPGDARKRERHRRRRRTRSGHEGRGRRSGRTPQPGRVASPSRPPGSSRQRRAALRAWVWPVAPATGAVVSFAVALLPLVAVAGGGVRPRTVALGQHLALACGARDRRRRQGGRHGRRGGGGVTPVGCTSKSAPSVGVHRRRVVQLQVGLVPASDVEGVAGAAAPRSTTFCPG